MFCISALSNFYFPLYFPSRLCVPGRIWWLFMAHATPLFDSAQETPRFRLQPIFLTAILQMGVLRPQSVHSHFVRISSSISRNPLARTEFFSLKYIPASTPCIRNWAFYCKRLNTAVQTTTPPSKLHWSFEEFLRLPCSDNRHLNFILFSPYVLFRRFSVVLARAFFSSLFTLCAVAIFYCLSDVSSVVPISLVGRFVIQHVCLESLHVALHNC